MLFWIKGSSMLCAWFLYLQIESCYFCYLHKVIYTAMVANNQRWRLAGRASFSSCFRVTGAPKGASGSIAAGRVHPCHWLRADQWCADGDHIYYMYINIPLPLGALFLSLFVFASHLECGEGSIAEWSPGATLEGIVGGACVRARNACSDFSSPHYALALWLWNLFLLLSFCHLMQSQRKYICSWFPCHKKPFWTLVFFT